MRPRPGWKIAPAAPPSRAAVLLAAAIVVWSVVGIIAAHAPWYAVGRFGVTGVERVSGQVFEVGLGLAAFLAGFTVLARGPLLAAPIAVFAGGALAGLGKYFWDVLRARSTIEPFIPGVQGSTSVHAGAFVALAAALFAFVAACAAWRRGL